MDLNASPSFVNNLGLAGQAQAEHLELGFELLDSRPASPSKACVSLYTGEISMEDFQKAQLAEAEALGRMGSYVLSLFLFIHSL